MRCDHCSEEIPLERPRSKFCSDKCCRDSWRKRKGWNHSDYVVRKRLRRRHWLDRYKTGKGCEHCGYDKHPEALHFDHLDPSKKRHIVSGMYGYSLKVLMDEVRKCRVLCANCHAVHSVKQQRDSI